MGIDFSWMDDLYKPQNKDVSDQLKEVIKKADRVFGIKNVENKFLVSDKLQQMIKDHDRAVQFNKNHYLYSKEILPDDLSIINKKMTTCFNNQPLENRVFVSTLELYYWKRWRGLSVRDECLKKYCNINEILPTHVFMLNDMNRKIENHKREKKFVDKLPPKNNDKKQESESKSGIILNNMLHNGDFFSVLDLKPIRCPYCNHHHTHFEKIENNFNRDGNYPNGSVFRQGNVTFYFYCEDFPNEHKWQLTFGEHKGCVYADFYKKKEIIPECIQSPIEKLFYKNFIKNSSIKITPQFEIGKYRVDFLINYKSLKVIIECDGHDYHEKTKEQAKYDKQRDRFLQSKGYTVFHFTGSEIHNDPQECVTEVINFLEGVNK